MRPVNSCTNVKETPFVGRHFFAAGFRESLFGLIFYIEYAYSSVPTVSQVTYNDKVWKSTQEADLMGVHMVTLGLSYVF